MSAVPPDPARHVALAERTYRRTRTRLETQQTLARQRRDDAIRAALQSGLRQAAITRATGLSRQRISQIAAEEIPGDV